MKDTILLKTISTLVFTLLISTTIFGQQSKPINYLGTKNTIMFDNVAYHLAWSAHPSGNYYKQEYLKQDDKIEKFKRLIIVEALTGMTKINDVVAAKVADLKKMKETNPIVNYEIFEKNGEVILDFLVSANTPDGKYLSIVERNVYRYKSITEKNGQNCVLLFALSDRAYGKDGNNFILKLKAHRVGLINLVGKFQLPEITINK